MVVSVAHTGNPNRIDEGFKNTRILRKSLFSHSLIINPHPFPDKYPQTSVIPPRNFNIHQPKMSQTKAEEEAVSTALCSSIHQQRTVENSAIYFLPVLNSLKEVNPRLKLLDVGCGWGHLTSNMAKVVGPDGHVIGIDIK